MPARIFDLRKRSEHLAAARRKTAGADALIDAAAEAVAKGAYSEAAERISAAETAVETLEKTLKNSTLDIYIDGEWVLCKRFPMCGGKQNVSLVIERASAEFLSNELHACKELRIINE